MDADSRAQGGAEVPTDPDEATEGLEDDEVGEGELLPESDDVDEGGEG